VEPITEREWGKLLQALPDNADPIAVRQAVEAAIRDYVGGADRDQHWREAWKQVAHHAGSQGVAKFCQALLKLQNFPLDPQVEELLRLAPLLMQIHSQAEVRAAVYLTTQRRARFMMAIARIWTDLGKGELRVSETGPFVDFLTSICERVDEDRSLNGAGVKKFVRREKARSDFLNSIKLELSGSSNMLINEAEVYVLDASGQRKSG
jgi:hypothetical protein